MSLPNASRETAPFKTMREGVPPGRFREGWLHLCNGLDPVRDGGMVPSILGMTAALASLGSPVRIVTPTPSSLGDTPVPPNVILQGPETEMDAVVKMAEVAHIHGLWQIQSRRGASLARQAGVPYIIAAHGMADPWAMRHKAWKKKVYTTLVEGKNMRRAACLHALSQPEIGHLRQIAPRTPVCFVPNGVNPTPLENLPDRSSLEREYPELRGKFVLLFYSRVHVKKGLDLLAQAFGRIQANYPDLHLLLAGNDDGALSPFMSLIESQGLTSRVTWVGHVSGEKARKVWAAADAFVLPSYSEGFSMAILEALVCRLPVLITTACHFSELAEFEGGLVVEPNLEDVTRGLNELLERSPAERKLLGETGRALVDQKYTWDQQARRLAEVYRWMSGGGPAPEAVVTAEQLA